MPSLNEFKKKRFQARVLIRRGGDIVSASEWRTNRLVYVKRKRAKETKWKMYFHRNAFQTQRSHTMSPRWGSVQDLRGATLLLCCHPGGVNTELC